MSNPAGRPVMDQSLIIQVCSRSSRCGPLLAGKERERERRTKLVRLSRQPSCMAVMRLLIFLYTAQCDCVVQFVWTMDNPTLCRPFCGRSICRVNTVAAIYLMITQCEFYNAGQRLPAWVLTCKRRLIEVAFLHKFTFAELRWSLTIAALCIQSMTIQSLPLSFSLRPVFTLSTYAAKVSTSRETDNLFQDPAGFKMRSHAFQFLCILFL